MPRRSHYEDGNFFRGKGRTYFTAEEALGIGIFILVLVLLLIFGCWFYKRRSGYKRLRSKGIGMDTIRTVVGEGARAACKTALQEYRNFNSVVPNAPPAYDKIAAEQSPPPYSP
ncbi:melanoma antigen recognized by T-cells 1 [Gallus gallus]|uniref:Melan-A n=1 Tax=Gallus gallus TaxID=9031 RepID=E1C403_CHICK|nr:melanoma antigen recognized by T-cells 1 [Gallus gallus]XP_046791678.1 melanoma antigen recognized by T-cells 1 [Gallus gallus]|eukprot:XP_001232043.1 melanoma antigen recognized by T-cells 1 [Gallus gallus]